MRILVTGGAGYIGSVVAAQLVAAGHDVVVYDNLSKGNRDAVPLQAKLIVGDVGDRACVDAALRDGNIDSVMHFAAWIEAGESMKEPERFFRNNTANALVLLEAILALPYSAVCLFFNSGSLWQPGALTDQRERPVAADQRLRGIEAFGRAHAGLVSSHSRAVLCQSALL